ncbi:MAG: 3-oxoacyl-(acyl-carrier-protein) reductase FabG [Spirochaetes bacterium ADurb.Bin110]|jgi:3-oxoacyl-[acyl-carrier protein] reductase|nr:MAG: 3-oxoacyl-(acyl-carrier-protein) reductase FabG [Spirochaetes bacterium ADurb.Bin110]
MELEEMVAVVTGSGNGLGMGIAKKMFVEGASLALWDINFESVKRLAFELDPSGQRVLPLKVDITDEAEVQAGVVNTVDRFGRIDVLVNNAGISRHKPLEETTLEIWDAVIKVNLTGTFICCKAVAPIMKRQEFGKIVNIASLGGRTGRPGVGVNYAASKGGVIGLTKLLAKELGPSNIYVNAICPGPILTDQTKQYPREVFDTWNAGRAVPKDGLPEDIGDAVVFLASKRSNWITGISLDVNGGIFIG